MQYSSPFSSLTPVATLLSTLLLVLAVFQVLQYFQALTSLLLVVVVMVYLLLGPVNTLEHWFIVLYGMLLKRFTRKQSWLRSQLLRFKSVLLHGPWLNARMLAVVCVYILLLGGFLGCAWLLWPVLQEQATALKASLPQYQHHIAMALQQVASMLQQAMGDNPLSDSLMGFVQTLSGRVNANIQTPSALITAPLSLSQGLQSSLERGASTVLEQLPEWLNLGFQGLMYLLSGLILTFYGLLDGSRLPKKLDALLPNGTIKVTINRYMRSIHQTLLAFIRGQLLLAVASGLLMLGLYSVFGVRYAILLSTLFTVAEIIPVVGPWLAFAPGLVVMLFGPNPWVTLYVLGLYALVKDNILLPNVVGNAMGLHPVVVILALLVSAKLAGWVGLVLAIPVTSLAGMMLKADKTVAPKTVV
jgi:predicted PurR-regulated permease PerM